MHREQRGRGQNRSLSGCKFHDLKVQIIAIFTSEIFDFFVKTECASFEWENNFADGQRKHRAIIKIEFE